MQLGLPVIGAVVGSVVALALLPSVARADDSEHEQPEAAWRQTWVHVFASRKAWSVTNGTTWAPSGSHDQNGVRLRLVGGTDGYRYKARQFDPGTSTGTLYEYAGLRQTLDGLAGYQWRIGPWTLKAFAGVHARRTVVEIRDLDLGGDGEVLKWSIAPKLVGEAWWHISETAWASVDIGVTSFERSYSARVRAAWRPHPAWSLGPEATAAGNTFSDIRRLGAFLRYDDGEHEISAAAGYDWTTGQQTAPYATVQYLYRY